MATNPKRAGLIEEAYDLLDRKLRATDSDYGTIVALALSELPKKEREQVLGEIIDLVVEVMANEPSDA